MPIELKCGNTACTTVMAVKEEHAGKSVKCPNCGTVTVVPSPSSAPPAPAPAPAAAASPPPPAPVGGAAAPAAANLMETVKNLAKANNLDDLGLYAVAGGLASLLLLILSTLLPRYSAIGAFVFLITVGVTGFVLVSFAKMYVFFEKAVYAAAGWGAFIFMVVILTLLVWEDIGPGQYLGLLASIAVAAAFGFLSYQRAMKK